MKRDRRMSGRPACIARGPRRAACLLALCSAAHAGQPAPRRDAYGDPLPGAAIARLGTDRMQHAEIGKPVVSPDGRYVAAAGGLNRRNDDKLSSVRIWEAGTGRLLREIPQAVDLRFTWDPGQYLIRCSGQVMRRCDLATGRTVAEWKPPFGVGGFDISPDGKTVAVIRKPAPVDPFDLEAPAHTPGLVALLDAETGRTLRTFRTATDNVGPLRYACDGRVVWLYPHEVRVWDPAKPAQAAAVIAFDKKTLLHSMAISPDGRLLALGAHGPILCDLATGQVRWRRAKMNQGSVAFTPDGKHVIVGGWPIRYLDARTGVQTRKLSAGGAAVARGGGTLAAINRITVATWNVHTGKLLVDLPRHSYYLYGLTFLADNKTVATFGGGTAFLWDARTGRLVRQLKATYSGGPVRFSPDGGLLLGRPNESRPFSVYVWDTQAGKERFTVRPDRGYVFDHRFTPDGKSLVLSAGYGSETNRSNRRSEIQFWDLAAKRRTRVLPAGAGWTYPLALTKDGAFLAGGNRKQLFVWDLPTGTKILAVSFPGRESGRCWCVDFSHDGRLIATVVGQVGYVTERITGKVLFRSSTFPVLVFRPGSYIVAGIRGEAGTIELHDCLTGRRLLALGGKQRLAATGERLGQRLAFSPDGRLLAAAAGRTALVWDLASLLDRRRLQAEIAAAERAKLFGLLGSDDPAAAAPAVRKLIDAGDAVVAPLAAMLGKAPPAGKLPDLARLIRDLDDDDWRVRERATESLIQLANQHPRHVLSALSDVARRAASPEVRLRIEVIQARSKAKPSCVLVRQVDRRVFRAIWVLEQIGSGKARGVLRRFAADKGHPLRAREAAAAGRRLTRRHGP